ncbi:hypothetical protein BJA5080_04792 [Bradyrhizobium diazoefficiens SEMIA 5080]|uniref:Uncharacterized protein n=1 Tax=Bradyrhizobium diazoefficiens SEMIA 5080 TaxID=754504 RepID=A0A837CKA8_9BRAD|nr:hypothetical protein BJA5080_04792 [Bradyrhizobium diazoefficiens SEMIA 5080]
MRSARRKSPSAQRLEDARRLTQPRDRQVALMRNFCTAVRASEEAPAGFDRPASGRRSATRRTISPHQEGLLTMCNL